MEQVKLLDETITIDPGANTGWAIWHNGEVIAYDVIKAPKQANEVELLRYLAAQLKLVFVEHKPKTMYIEGVELWSTSMTSVVSARRGNLFTLAYIVGTYIRLALSRGMSVKLVYPREWKGNMNNDITRARILKVLGKKFPDHTAEAVGIGLAAMGKL